MAKKSVIVIGDVSLAQHTAGEATHDPVNGPVLTVKSDSFRESLGIAGEVASYVRALGPSALLLTAVGDDVNGVTVGQLAGNAGISVYLAKWWRPTCVQHTISAGGQELVHVVSGGGSTADWATGPGELAHGLYGIPSTVWDEAAAVVLVDAGFGTIGPAILEQVRAQCIQHGVPMLVYPRADAFPQHYSAAVLLMSLSDALHVLAADVHPGLSSGIAVHEQAIAACKQLRQRSSQYGAVMIIYPGGYCYTAFDGSVQSYESRDLCSLSVIAGIAAGLTEDMSMEQLFAFAACCGEAAASGATLAGLRDAVDEMTAAASGMAGKLMSLGELVSFVDRRRRIHPGHSVVCVMSDFVFLNSSELDMLRFAAGYGDIVIALYPADPQASEEFNELCEQRLMSQECVDAVVRCEYDAMSVIRHVKPEVFVRPSDFPAGKIEDYVAQHGGRVEVFRNAKQPPSLG